MHRYNTPIWKTLAPKWDRGCAFTPGWDYMYKLVLTLYVVDVDVLCRRSRMAAAHSHVIYTFHVL